MCGIAGMVGNKGSDKDLPDLMMDLSLFMSLRGRDSSGVVSVTGNSYWTEKGPMDMNTMLTRVPAFKNIISRANQSDAMIVHCRAASGGTGQPSYATSHPFFHGNIVGVHNGYISNTKPVKFDVDSDWAISQIAALGAIPALESFTGGYALVWYDWTLKQLRMARNDSKTLYVAKLSCGKHIFASEALALVYAADRNMTKITNLYEVQPGILYSFDGKSGELVGKENFTVKKATVPPAGQGTGTTELTTTGHTAGGTTTTKYLASSLDEVGCDTVWRECWVGNYLKIAYHLKLIESADKNNVPAHIKRTKQDLDVLEYVVGYEVPVSTFRDVFSSSASYSILTNAVEMQANSYTSTGDTTTVKIRLFVSPTHAKSQNSILVWLKSTQPKDVSVEVVGMTHFGDPVGILSKDSYEAYCAWRKEKEGVKG